MWETFLGAFLRAEIATRRISKFKGIPIDMIVKSEMYIALVNGVAILF